MKDILKLQPSQESVAEILNFIEHKTLTVLEHQTVFIHLMKTYYALKAYPIVLNEGIAYHEKLIQQNQNTELEVLYELIYLSALSLEKYDIAYAYIQYRREVLPVNKRYLADLNLVEFKKVTHQNYTEDIERLLQDTLPNDIKLSLLKDLLVNYLNQNEPNKAITLMAELKRLDYEQSYIPLYLKTLLQLNQYTEAKLIANQYRQDKRHEMSAFMTLLEVYVHEKDSHRLAILDGDFSEKIELESPEFRLKAYELFMNFYEEIKNKFLYDNYAKKLKNLQKELKKQKKNESVIDEKKDSGIKVTDHQVSITPKVLEIKENIYHMDALIELFGYAHQIHDNKHYREYLRLFFMRVSEVVDATDFIVFTSKDDMLYHYKKERLYDKELIPQSYYDTIIHDVLKDGQERFGTPKSFMDSKNILTGKPYDESVGYIYSFALYDLGAFMVYLKDEIQDPGTFFDLFKGISTIIYGSLKDEEKIGNIRTENTFLRHILDSNLMNLRIMTNHQSTYNIASQKLLNVDSHLPFELFLRNLGVHEVKTYEQSVQRLFEKAGLMDVVTYVYLDKQIKERLVSIATKDEIHVISIFDDITHIYDERKKLIEEATVDFETSLLNLNALHNNFEKYIQDKGSFLLISFNESILPIYGSDITLKFFKEFGQRSQKFFEDGTVYRYGTNQLFVYIPMNDIRSVTRLLKAYIKYLNDTESVVISYEQFEPKIAVIRYPVVTEEKLPSKIFRYLELSLDYLKRKADNESYIFYEHAIYENEVFEQQVINYLNQAIETNQLSLAFEQVIDLDRNIIWQYESDLILENIAVDSKYLHAIAKKRNRLEALEHHHIKMVCEFLHTLEKETTKLIKITIPVSKETFTSIDFNPYIFGLFHEYNIPFEFIRFKVKGDNLKINQHLNQISELDNAGIGLDTTSVETALSYPFNALHIDFKSTDDKWSQYIQSMHQLFLRHQMAVIVREVKSAEHKEILQSLGIKYVQGDMYKPITADRLFIKIKGNSSNDN